MFKIFEGCSNLTSITIPSSITTISGSSFGSCTSLTSVTIPNNVTRIGDGAFSGCSSLISVTIPNSVTIIDKFAFHGCIGLKSIILGKSVSRIEYYSFANCLELTDVYCLAENVPNTLAYAFLDSFIEYATLHVPAESLEAYKNSEPWKLFMEVVPLDDSEISETSISNNVLEKKQNAQIYDIYGRRLSKPSKGVNIMDGKKVIIK